MSLNAACSWIRNAVLAFTAVLAAGDVSAAPVFYGPTTYLSSADIPSGFYSGLPTFLEDFEDGSLDGGITASAGTVFGPNVSVDSVDGDDGIIDGSGLDGRSFFYAGGAVGVTFTFASPVTAAAAVWTDGSGVTTFEAFGDGMVSLGVFGPFSIADGTFYGSTGEDSFFGVTDPNGIRAIKLASSVGGIEIDHVQYGVMAVPIPAAFPLLGGGLAVLASSAGIAETVASSK